MMPPALRLYSTPSPMPVTTDCQIGEDADDPSIRARNEFSSSIGSQAPSVNGPSGLAVPWKYWIGAADEHAHAP